MMTRMALVVAIAFVGLTLVGCGGSRPQFGQYDLAVQLDPAVRAEATPPNIAVHVVGVSQNDQAKWDGLNVTDYWMPDSPMRAGVGDQTRQIAFGPGNTETVVIKKSDPIWKKWSERQAANLYVIASLPGIGGAPGNDPRLYRIPLETTNWTDDQKLQVTVKRGQVQLDTQPQPKPVK